MRRNGETRFDQILSDVNLKELNISSIFNYTDQKSLNG